jgi:cytochrome c-type biogenesis protein CcsB
MAVVVMFIFGITIGGATFIENDYGTQTARALVYNAKWFEFFMLYFIVILIYNMIKVKSYKTRLPVFLFHFSFIVIAVGALLTRFVGFEGIMHIREGQVSSQMVSDIQILQVSLDDGKEKEEYSKNIFLSSMTKNHISSTIDIGDKSLNIELLDYLPNVEKEIVDSKDGEKILEFKLVGSNAKGKIIPIKSGTEYDAGTFVLLYNKEVKTTKPQFIVEDDKNGKLIMKTAFPMDYLRMDDKKSGKVEAGKYLLERRYLYRFNGNAVVLKSVHQKAKVQYKAIGLKSKSGKPEFLSFKLSIGDKSKVIDILTNKGTVGDIISLNLDGVDIKISYGSKVIQVPFGIKLVKFDLERYPGSMTPSSYASDVILIDKEQNINMPYRIFMNNVLDHRNYRFFQSSYDMDEKGTILSVNHDPGTMPTYLGYLLLTIGMLWSLFIHKGRFQMLLRGARKLQNIAPAILVVALLSSVSSYAGGDTIYKYNKVHAEKFGNLVVQDRQGRMKPMDTLAHEVISKITGKSSIFGLTADQIFLGMLTNPSEYQNLKMIKIGHPKIAISLGLDKSAKLAKYSDFFTDKGQYKIYAEVSVAVRKKPLEKSQYDKELIKIDERVNVAYMVYSGSLLAIYPIPNDANNKWLSPIEAIKNLPSKEGQIVQMITRNYFINIEESIKSGDWKKADDALALISQYQHSYGKAVIPSKKHIEMEISYNKLGLFSKLVPLYLFLGLGLILFAFINVLKPSFKIDKIMKVSWVILIIGFILHMIGMAIRWYIAGHAPWSNAYESIVFIAGATVIAGLILAKNSPFALAGTALLAGITMAVAHMNFINPEITNLVPVLKSYWLMIHVATIISGDGFLGLGSILSLFVLILFIIRKENNKESIDRSIKELTNLAEMSLIIGLMLMTVGNFLGGIWANESWGRYWGWDPKETWAGVTILIYATVLHLRFIPAMKSIYIFNIASVWAYSSVLMTYFGVNYYLSGLHSYAAGDPIPFPMWAWYSIAGLLVLSLLASRNRKLK